MQSAAFTGSSNTAEVITMTAAELGSSRTGAHRDDYIAQSATRLVQAPDLRRHLKDCIYFVDSTRSAPADARGNRQVVIIASGT
jgi:hypothetical protein